MLYLLPVIMIIVWGTYSSFLIAKALEIAKREAIFIWAIHSIHLRI